MIRSVGFVLALVAAAFMAGCADSSGPKTVPAKGTLTIDGQPADNVQINLVPADASLSPASGNVAKGSFELFSGAQGKSGASPGKYKLTLRQLTSGEDQAAMYKSGKKGPPPAPKPTFPEKYLQADTSDKEVEIPASGTSALKIEI